MNAVFDYVRNLINSFSWNENDFATKSSTSSKRDRNEDDTTRDDSRALKRLKLIRKTSFPDVMETKDIWEEEKQRRNVQYIPIQVESGHPSTSTPNEGIAKLSSRARTVPIKLVDITSNGPSSPPRRPRMHTPIKPTIQAVVDDEDSEEEVTWIESKPEYINKKPSKVYIDLDDEENDNEEQDVIFVKKVPPTTKQKPYKFFVSKNEEHQEEDVLDNMKYYKLSKKLNNKQPISNLRTYSKFKSTPGISKTYKRSPTPVARWMLPQRNPATNRISESRSSPNFATRATLSNIFNLDEKKNYQELIRRVSDTTKPVKHTIFSLAQESASFRSTLQSQKNALNEIKLVEKGIFLDRENESAREYDPITVASINSSDSEVEIVPSETSTSSSIRIEPINTLRDSYRDKAITSSDWLKQINSKYKIRDFDTKEKLKDAKQESDIISKLVLEQKVAHLEHKLKYEFSIPESLIEEPQPTVELPPLTPEQEKLVNRALGPGPPSQLLVEKFSLRISKRDLQTLSGLNWLNDEVINFYMNLLMQRSEERKDLPKVYAKNTFFYPKLMQSGQAGVRRWTRKVDIFLYDLIVVPVHLGVHWCLSLIDFRRKKISYLDSMGGSNQACLSALLQYLRDEHKDKKGAPFDDAGWTTQSLKDIPQQMNGCDCGMFACTFAEFSCRDAPYTFTQAHMPYLRRKAALEILQARLLL